MAIDSEGFRETAHNARQALLDARNAAGHWEGELSSSALSTATAVFALALFRRETPNPFGDEHIRSGLVWLAIHQNADGGWGDTVASFSNISTTALCWAAFASARTGEYASTLAAAEGWLVRHAGSIAPNQLIPAIIARYGKDRTFSVPILTMCALAGRLGEGRDAWRSVPQLPFELAALPQRWFKWLGLPVVSYALPALIAIGLVRHEQRPTRNPVTLAARIVARSRARRLLTRIQPESGGFLEATPLTSFVVMSLVGAGLVQHPVTLRGVNFLVRSARPDGSWPIDTNLATWVTTLSANALQNDDALTHADRAKIRDWLLAQQYQAEHPYTLADPGCWAWTNLAGGVPDADDTPGALLALRHSGAADEQTIAAATAGVRWLLDLQNRDGGLPTFCRGWGKLPFDRSSADLTAHTLRDWDLWKAYLPPEIRDRVVRAESRAIEYLQRCQRPDGAWTPLWFGNQHAADDENPTYGTARVLLARSNESPGWMTALHRGRQWLIDNQNDDGGWGGGRGTPSSIEETAIAVEALTPYPESVPAVERGIGWLIDHTNKGRTFEPSPIGFYFAKLWYFEKLYPLIFTVAAFKAVQASQAANSISAGDIHAASFQT